MFSIVICGPQIYRSAISDHLRLYRGDIRVAAQSNQPSDARSLISQIVPEAVLLISGAGITAALAEVRELRRIDLDVNIVWWALHAEALQFQEVLQDQARVVGWDSDASKIVDALGAPLHKPAQMRPVPKLTGQEHLILQLAADGMSNRAIAFRLAISESTVKNHLRHIGAKFNTSSRAQAVWQAVQWGYLNPADVPRITSNYPIAG